MSDLVKQIAAVSARPDVIAWAGPYNPTLTDVAILRLTPWLPCLAGERERNVQKRAHKTIGVDTDRRLTVKEAEREILALLSGGAAR